MNFLFYVGIIVPTVITVALFFIFIYCWFLQKARKEVMTRKYDPHGQMRRLGMSMNPPPPPTFSLMEDVLLSEIGEDNIAYDVSRSPSTEQTGRGRPMYHTYHDSGISAGLSPSQDSEPRHSLVYRTCPDSGISGLGPQLPQSNPPTSKGYFQVNEVLQRQPHLQQVYEDQIDVHINRQQQCHQQLPQATLHHNLVQASDNSTHGVCYGDDSSHPQSSHSSISHPTSLNLADYDRQIRLMAHTHNSPVDSVLPRQQFILSPVSGNGGQQMLQQNGQLCFRANQISENCHNQALQSQRRQEITVVPISAEQQLSNRVILLSPTQKASPHVSLTPDDNRLQFSQNDFSLASQNTKPLRHSYRDSGVLDLGQSTSTGTERPDSQASHSSTTDSEDSGFRSSYCAAHHKAVLNKQGNPLLKPLRKSRHNRSNNKASKKTTNCAGSHRTSHTISPITLSPKNLALSTNSSSVHISSPSNPELCGRSNSIHHKHTNIPCSLSAERISRSSTETSHGIALNFYDDSHHSSPHHHSPTYDIWPPQSSNENEITVQQNIDLNDISTHLSWKYLQTASRPNAGPPNESLVTGPCHQSMRPGQINQLSREQHMEVYGHSVV